MTKSNLGRKGFLSGYKLIVHYEGKSRQEPKAGTWRQEVKLGYGRVLLTGLLPMTCSMMMMMTTTTMMMMIASLMKTYFILFVLILPYWGLIFFTIKCANFNTKFKENEHILTSNQ